MRHPFFYFQNYTKAINSLMEYDEQKEYLPVIKQYLEILSYAIEKMEEGNTSRYKNIFEDLPMEKYYGIDKAILSQVMYGYVSDDVELSNEEWFRVFKMILLNFKIMVYVFYDCDLNYEYPDADMHFINAAQFSEDLSDMFNELNLKYKNYFPAEIDPCNWPLVHIGKKSEWCEQIYFEFIYGDEEYNCTDSDDTDTDETD
ncbi:asb059 [Agrotis segetum nucleopolyhedrovirus B]|uniref:Asb059 n=1 Tax=Agrotis segetum nucleopolyhedrovirus B TaxID=1580580 RepID=A0A0A7KRF5_9ABAC|nr:asb059 [Agrotis segetum nucleopolyhedrovirus B]AIZ48708.1 asb059 [Agrotis segetum nucleopolyhedrovirus B]